MEALPSLSTNVNHSLLIFLIPFLCVRVLPFHFQHFASRFLIQLHSISHHIKNSFLNNFRLPSFFIYHECFTIFIILQSILKGLIKKQSIIIYSITNPFRFKLFYSIFCFWFFCVIVSLADIHSILLFNENVNDRFNNIST